MTTTPAHPAPRKSSIYPHPLTIPPLRSPHRQTLILLHGRGSHASKFGPPLLAQPIAGLSSFPTLPQALLHAKFLLPTASTRRATLYKRAPIAQWFDNWALATPTEREELQVQGLRETSAYIHGLLRGEIARVGAKNVVVGGLSQGGAAALVAIMLWEGQRVGGVVGLCTWLPYRAHLEDIARGEDGAETDVGLGEDPFAAEPGSDEDSGEVGAEFDLPTRAVAWLCEELEVEGPPKGMPFQQVPLFLGHGVEDDRVGLGLGREAKGCMEALGARVRWREYEGLGHWYSGEMLRDLLEFLREEVGWDIGEGG